MLEFYVKYRIVFISLFEVKPTVVPFHLNHSGIPGFHELSICPALTACNESKPIFTLDSMNLF